ncbi:MAG: LPS-assembly protein LptD [Pseudomonadales bacterium]|nr:LPS-assembly protein LptD [Pseudomonadales bacterium]
MGEELAKKPRDSSFDESLASIEWRTRDELSPAQQRNLPSHCLGRYIEPEYIDESGQDRSQVPVHGQAGRLSWFEGVANLSDGVTIEQGNTSIETGQATYFEDKRRVVLPEVVTLRQPGMVVRGQQGEVNMTGESARLESAEFVLPDSEFRGSSVLVEKQDSGDLKLHQSIFTRCEPGNDSWTLKSNSFVIEKDSIYGIARQAVLRVGKVPIFYTPYIKFPITDDRQSGFLFPGMTYSEEDGLDLTVPYYLNLAPNYDATLATRIITRRGPGVEVEFHHLGTWQETEIGGAYLHKDKLFNGELSHGDFFRDNPEGKFNRADRWLVNADHRGQLGRISTRVAYSKVSDDEYFRDLGSDLNVTSQVQLERRAELRYARAGLSARFWAQAFQNLDVLQPNAYQRLPEVELNWRHRFGRFNFKVAGEWASFDRDNAAFTGINKIVGDRAHFEPRLELPLNWRSGFLKFAAAYKYTQYNLQDVPLNDDPEPERTIGLGSVDGGLFFERDVSLFGVALVQTLEPRVFYLYQQYENQDALPRFDSSELTFGYSQLYRDNRFTGLDRLGDANQVSLGLTSRFMGASNGREYVRASLGQIRYLKDRRVSLNTPESQPSGDKNISSSSAVAGEISARVDRQWRIGASMVWDSKRSKVDESNFFLQFKRDERRIFNLGYRSRNLASDISQADGSLYWALSKRWSLIARYNYDLEFDRTIEAFGGLEYNDCCWRLRVLVRKYIDNPGNRPVQDLDSDSGVFVQIVFKGLAGFGGKIDNIMENGIRGFQRRP